jgi:hypothetical protein
MRAPPDLHIAHPPYQIEHPRRLVELTRHQIKHRRRKSTSGGAESSYAGVKSERDRFAPPELDSLVVLLHGSPTVLLRDYECFAAPAGAVRGGSLVPSSAPPLQGLSGPTTSTMPRNRSRARTEVEGPLDPLDPAPEEAIAGVRLPRWGLAPRARFPPGPRARSCHRPHVARRRHRPREPARCLLCSCRGGRWGKDEWEETRKGKFNDRRVPHDR